ncbi:MAG: permease prefix domain 1-containing protein [Planctomycetota bacterium]|nr:permease prefix domain 1-containing protein [Planctomycetota bacterium]
MISPEFDKFLEHLGGCLRLSQSQRDVIRTELEDHFESQLADLTSGGMSSHDAMTKVLDEFGDAAELVGRFSQIGRKRRWFMRSAIAASIVVTATLVTSFLMPPQPGNPFTPGFINAASPSGLDGVPSVPVPVAVATPNPNDDEVHAALGKNVSEVKLDDVTFADALSYFQELAVINIVVDWEALELEGVDSDKQVSLKLKNVSLSRTLELVLEIGGGPFADLGYQVDDGVLRVTTQSEICKRTEVRLYNCASLFERENPRWLEDEVKRVVMNVYGPGGSGATNYKAGHPSDRVRLEAMSDLLEVAGRRRVEELCRVIQSSVDPDSWRESGGSAGSLTIFDDVFVIVQTADNHDAIGRLLDKLNSVRLAGDLARSG